MNKYKGKVNLQVTLQRWLLKRRISLQQTFSLTPSDLQMDVVFWTNDADLAPHIKGRGFAVHRRPVGVGCYESVGMEGEEGEYWGEGGEEVGRACEEVWDWVVGVCAVCGAAGACECPWWDIGYSTGETFIIPTWWCLC